MTDMTQFIAMVAGPYLIVTGLGFLVSTRYYETMVTGGNPTDPVVINLSGAVHFLVGLIILIKHFRWDGVPEVVVTLIGLAALCKGVALIAVPELTLKSSATTRTKMRASGAGFLLVGSYLGYVGWSGTS